MDNDAILDIVAVRPYMGMPLQPTLADAMAAGLDYECVLSATWHTPCVVFLRDPTTGWTREWHRCLDWEHAGDDVRRCRHVNGDGTRCTMHVVGQTYTAQNVCEYVKLESKVDR